MNENKIKKAYVQAEKEVQEQKKKEEEKQVEQVKNIIKRTLEEIENLKGQKKDIEDKLAILKMDIDDMKKGKLDKIKERQEKDPLAKKVSIIIIKEKEIIREREVQSPWYQPYTITWNTKTYPYQDTAVYCNNLVDLVAEPNAYNLGYTTSDCTTALPSVTAFTLNNSVVKDSAVGTYKLAKKIIHLR